MSERQPESQLQRARQIGGIDILHRGTVIRSHFPAACPASRTEVQSSVGSIVRVVERVVELQEAIDAHTTPQRESPLEPQIHAVNRLSDKAIARNNASIGAEPPLALRHPCATQV